MKVLGTILAFAILATPLSAGKLVFEAEEEQEIIIVEDQPMGSSGAWIIPLIAIALIGLAISTDDGPRRPD